MHAGRGQAEDRADFPPQAGHAAGLDVAARRSEVRRQLLELPDILGLEVEHERLPGAQGFDDRLEVVAQCTVNRESHRGFEIPQ